MASLMQEMVRLPNKFDFPLYHVSARFPTIVRSMLTMP